MERHPRGQEAFWKTTEGGGGLILATDVVSVPLGRECGNAVIRKSPKFLCTKNLPLSGPLKDLQ